MICCAGGGGCAIIQTGGRNIYMFIYIYVGEKVLGEKKNRENMSEESKAMSVCPC